MHKIYHLILFSFFICLVALSCTDKKDNSKTQAEENLQSNEKITPKLNSNEIKQLNSMESDIQKETEELEKLLEEIEK